jgi:hypothetical protein
VRFAENGSSPIKGEARRGRGFAVWLVCGGSPSPNPSLDGRGSLWSVLWGVAISNSFLNFGQDTLEIIPNLRVPKTQDVKALIRKKLISNFIVRIIQMLTAVSFHNQFVFKANKIENISANRFLTTKLYAKMFAAQSIPQNAFFWSHRPSKFASYIRHRHTFYYELHGRI